MMDAGPVKPDFISATDATLESEVSQSARRWLVPGDLSIMGLYQVLYEF